MASASGGSDARGVPKPHGAPREGPVPASESLADAAARVAGNVRRRRRAAGLTQEQLAELADCTVRHLQRIEAGTTPNLSLGLLCALADALEADVHDLLRPVRSQPTRRPGRPRRKPKTRR